MVRDVTRSDRFCGARGAERVLDLGCDVAVAAPPMDNSTGGAAVGGVSTILVPPPLPPFRWDVRPRTIVVEGLVA